MIMRPGQQLLLPANPLFIWGTLLLALLAHMVPLGRTPRHPATQAGVLRVWSVRQPPPGGRGAGRAGAFRAGLLARAR